MCYGFRVVSLVKLLVDIDGSVFPSNTTSRGFTSNTTSRYCRGGFTSNTST